jgi:ABC-type microcin C transport system duplicated ATPase subunit YejF
MLLSIRDLKVAFRMGRVDGVAQRADAVKGVSFDIPENTIVALVGDECDRVVAELERHAAKGRGGRA